MLPEMIGSLKRLFALVGFFVGVGTTAGAVFHVDNQGGDDARDGTDPSLAWKTLERVNQQIFQPGDQVLFKAGGRWAGQFKPQGSGAETNGQTVPIIVAGYGEGARPCIDGEGRFLDAVLLRNVEFWEIRDMEITNTGTNRQAFQTGVRLVSDGFGPMRGIRLRNLFVHDVNGDLRKSHEGCGIYFESRGGNGSRFDDLLIENCHVVRTDRNGICQRGGGRERSTGVVIRNNLLEDIGGDGIKVWGSNGALIESNVVRGARMRCEDHAAGIWPFDSDDTIIQFNEVSGVKGTLDGQAFDADYRCRRSLFQYNYSHDNEGGFFLVCGPGRSYNTDTVIRYNLSRNDGIGSARVFHFGGNARNTKVYNNTVYLGPDQDLPLLLFDEWEGGFNEGTQFYNNLFYVEGRATYRWGRSMNRLFDNNVFYGVHVDPPPDANASTNRPSLIDPRSGGDGFASLEGLKLKDATDLPIGRIVPDNGGRDFFGNPLPQDRPPTVGAFQLPMNAERPPRR
jgi:hypothetical protein